MKLLITTARIWRRGGIRTVTGAAGSASYRLQVAAGTENAAVPKAPCTTLLHGLPADNLNANTAELAEFALRFASGKVPMSGASARSLSIHI